MILRSERKTQTRDNILKAASKLFRKNGYHATGVDAVMKEAGLTPGGFYAHFRSKQQLLQKSLESAQGQLRQMWKEMGARHFLGIYLSPQHRDHPEKGCILATLGPELLREDKASRQMIGNQLENFSQIFSERLSQSSENEALLLAASAMGALQLSRHLGSSPESDEFLNFAAQRLGEIYLK